MTSERGHGVCPCAQDLAAARRRPRSFGKRGGLLERDRGVLVPAERCERARAGREAVQERLLVLGAFGERNRLLGQPERPVMVTGGELDPGLGVGEVREEAIVRCGSEPRTGYRLPRSGDIPESGVRLRELVLDEADFESRFRSVKQRECLETSPDRRLQVAIRPVRRGHRGEKYAAASRVELRCVVACFLEVRQSGGRVALIRLQRREADQEPGRKVSAQVEAIPDSVENPPQERPRLFWIVLLHVSRREPVLGAGAISSAPQLREGGSRLGGGPDRLGGPIQSTQRLRNGNKERRASPPLGSPVE